MVIFYSYVNVYQRVLQCQLWTNKHPAAGCKNWQGTIKKCEIPMAAWLPFANSEVDIPTVTFPGCLRSKPGLVIQHVSPRSGGETPAF